MDDPLLYALGIWNGGSPEQRQHIQYIWPELYDVMGKLDQLSARVIRDPASVVIPAVKPTPKPSRGYRGSPTPPGLVARPPRGGAGVSRGRSASRSGPSGTGPTSDRSAPVQLPLFDPTEETK